MYRVKIDYERKLPVGNHWYGNFDEVVLPKIPNTNVSFYNIISLECAAIPLNLTFTVSRIYLPHYLTSDIAVEDIYFGFMPGRVELLNNFAHAHFKIFDDYIDHTPRNVSFERLPEIHNPVSPHFDEEQLIYPHHQLGGTPYFKQLDGHHLVCLKCGTLMSFLLQFDNDDMLDADFEDDGTAYYWWCEHCQIAGCRVESA